MSRNSVKSAIDQALKTPAGRSLVSKAEAKAITNAALTEPHASPHVTGDEAKLVDRLLHEQTFEGDPKYHLTGPARQVLEAFAVSQGLPIGANVDAMRAKFESILAGAPQGTPLATPPSTGNLLKVTLSDGRAADGALREALMNPANGSFFLRTTSQSRGQPKPVTSYFGPFSLGAAQPKLSAAELGARVTQAGAGYLFPSETDIPLRFLTGPRASTVNSAAVLSAFAAQHDAAANSMFGTSGSTPLADKFVQEVPAADFFARYSTASDPNDTVSVDNAKKFAAVASLLEANLTDLHVYRFSEADPTDHIRAPGQVSIFIAGRASSGELVGVMTGAVET